jgi:hypothetical protein
VSLGEQKMCASVNSRFTVRIFKQVAIMQGGGGGGGGSVHWSVTVLISVRKGAF